MIRVLAALGILLGTTLLGMFAIAPASAAPDDGDGPAPAPFVLPEKVTTAGMTEADRIFLEKVRQAGLWEIPAGEMAIQKGSTERIRQVGQLIAADHAVLDDDVRRLSVALGVSLPDDPTDQQQIWLDDMKAKSGQAFDDSFAQNLRFAHGAVYAAIAQVRAGSRNEAMRAFAKQCEIFVHRHMSLLESTGDVNYADLPLPVVSRGNLRQAKPDQPLLLIALFAVTGALGVAGVARALRGAA